MREIFACACLTLSLTSSCGDDGDQPGRLDASMNDAAIADAGQSSEAAQMDARSGDLLTCMEGDQALGGRLRQGGEAGTTTDFAQCTRDDECTTWQPVFECKAQNIRLSQCAAPVAVSQVAAAQRWLDGFARDLCDRIAPNCVGTGDCIGGASRCVEGTCKFVQGDGGS